MFDISDNKGFHITFENGWTVSVQWGAGNYSDNYDLGILSRSHKYGNRVPPSPTAEIAAWSSQLEWYKFEHDEVEGYQTPAQVLEFMNKIAALEPSK